MRAAFLFCLAACLYAQVMPESPVANGDKGSIDGTVVNQVTGAPVSRAQVTLLPVNVGGGRVSSTMTDAAGNFSAKDLPPGTYNVMAQHPDYPEGNRRSPIRSRIDLQPGEQKRDVTIMLVPGAAISGRVVDVDGDPLTGCSVTVLRPNNQPGRGAAPLAGDQTDDHGQYRIFNLTAGSYYVRVECARQPATPHPLMTRDSIEQLPEQGYPSLFYPASPDFAGATAIKAAAGTERQGIDFQLDRVPVFSVSGTLTGLNDRKDVQLSLMAKDSLSGNSFQRGNRWDTRTGKFTFHGIPPGDYILSAFTVNEGLSYAARLNVPVSDSSINGLVVPFRPAMEIRGMFEMEDSGDSKPPAQPQIYLRPTENISMYTYPTEEAGENGAFAFKGVVPGRWNVGVNNLPPGSYVKSIRFGDQEVTGGVLDIAQDAAGPLKIVISAKAATIEGNVTGAEAPCLIVALPQNATAALPIQPSTGTDAQGHFILTGLAPGSYRLFALDPSIGYPDPDLLKKLESRGETVTVSEGEKGSTQLQFIPPSAIED